MTMTAEHTEVTIRNVEDFQRWEEASRDTIDVKRCYIDLAGDLVTGILLSQIIFWFLPGKSGYMKTRIEHDGKHWLAKSRTDWWNECRITPKQFDRSIKILRDKGLVETRLFKFSGTPTLHVWLNWPALVEGVNLILPKGENRYLPKVKIDIDQKVKTSNIDYLTKTTDIDYPKTEEEEEDHNHPIGFFHENFGEVNQVIEEELRDLIENFGPELVKRAIKEAARHRVSSPLPYLRAVLEREGKEKEKRSAEEKEKIFTWNDTDGKRAFDKAPNVFLTKSEVLALVKRFGSPGAEARIDFLSQYKASTGKNYESDFSTILFWDKRGNPWDDTPWEPEPPEDWVIKQEWLDSLQPKPALQPVKDGQCGTFVICGYTDTRYTCSERPFGSLILGLPAKEGLRWVGNCGGGFKRTGMEAMPKLYERLQDIRTDHSPLEPGTETKLQKRSSRIQWLRPVLVCQVKYSEVTRAGMLYQAMFRHLRPDLIPEDASYDGGINVDSRRG